MTRSAEPTGAIAAARPPIGRRATLPYSLDERVRLALELALAGERVDPVELERLEARAADLGMSGAEIDAARRGWSFDVLTSVALALALAPSAEESSRQRARAIRSGISKQQCDEIEALARRQSEGVSSHV